MRGLLNTLKSSHRNSAPYRSVNLKVLNTEKSTFLKPESRKMFRPIVPNVLGRGGTMTDPPLTKQPPAASVLALGAIAVHCPPSDDGSVAVRPEIPDSEVQVAAPMLAKVTPVAGAFGNAQKGIELEPDLKSAGIPKKSQRPVGSPVPMQSHCVSCPSHGW